MRFHTHAAAIALGVMLVTAGCTGMFGDSAGSTAPVSNTDEAVDRMPSNGAGVTDDTARRPSQDSSPGRTIQIGASGQVETEPNQAVLRVAVSATGQTAASVRQQMAENVSRMRDALTDMGIGSDQITTADYDISSNRRYGPREREEPPFRGRHSFTITLTDLDSTGQVIVTVVENGATSVDDVHFTLSEEERRELRKEALADAMSNARGQADVIAERADLSITGVGAVQTAEVGVHPVRFEATALAAGGAGGGGTSIEGGTVTVTAQVQVTYNATG